jgi:predicted ribosome-associated RNA-binding protein Tma20
MKNTQYDGVIWILTLTDCNCNKSFHFLIFSKFENRIELQLEIVFFLGLKYITFIDISKFTIKVDKGASTFLMNGCERVDLLKNIE